MKVNSIVLIEHANLLRVGVITKRITEENMDHTALKCVVRLASHSKKISPTRVETSEGLLTDMTELMDGHEMFSHPALSALRNSDDWKEAVNFQAQVLAKPNEDPDEIQF